ncbi:MAG: TIGR00730 family Rossman fold protein [Bacteroidota bacterium]
MKSIAVFCGSSSGNNGIYREMAGVLGRTLAKQKIQLIYGGGKVGLMGVIADAALEAGGHVTGVIPGFLQTREVAHDNLTEIFRVESMHERKALIDKMSDGVIAMPGGFGTLDEMFEMLTWGQLGLHQKPVGLLNVNGFFSNIMSAIETMVDEGFLNQINKEMVLISEDVGELLSKMNSYSAPDVPKWI